MSNKLITVIMPVYNSAKFLQNALNSIYAQNYQPIEIIVVDDGSTDTSAKIAKSNKNIKYIFQENQGSAVARNNGILHAKGELISFLDSDDYWGNEFLIAFSQYFQTETELEMIQGLIQKVQSVSSNNSTKLIDQPYFHCLFGSGMYKKEVFQKVGLLDPDLKQCQDLDWHLKCWENQVVLKRINSVVLFYRDHEKNITKNISQQLFYRKLSFHKHLIRTRNKKIESDIDVMKFIGYIPEEF